MDKHTPPTITLDTVVGQSDQLMSADVGDEVVMLHLAHDAYYDTDDIGADIWHRLARPVAVRDLCLELVQRYAVDLATCQADVLAFLDEAYQEGVIRVVATP
jgi:Coenzyme PQQ synthesis protein D (PqqD)